jgi:DNA-binding transcriptional LysR family regulator
VQFVALRARTPLRRDDPSKSPAALTLVAHAGGGRSAMHETVEDLFAAIGAQAEIAHQVAETSTLVTFVAAGLGLAVVPEPTSDLAVPGLVYVPLVGAAGVDLVAATRTGDENAVLARAVEMLADLAR